MREPLTDLVPPPQVRWHESLIRSAGEWSQPLPGVIRAIVGTVIDLSGEVWQMFWHHDFKAQYMKRHQFWIDQAKDTQGIVPKVAVITGANAGLGFETAKGLVEAGYLVILACRSVTRGHEAVEKIEALTGITKMAVVMEMDLSSFESIKAFALDFKTRGYNLDVLINNAAALDIPFSLTKDGFEMQFGVHHLGHFLLTIELLPLLNKSLQGRIVVLSSFALYFSDGIHYDRLRTNICYCRFDSYAQSKLANMLFVKSLSRRLKQAKSKVTVNAMHPGMCYTPLVQNTRYMTAISLPLSKCLLRSPLEGANTLFYLALAPELEAVSGEYFFDMTPRSVSSIAADESAQEELWAASVQYTGMDISSGTVGPM